MPALPPKRPKPLSFTPPNGICASSCTVGPLMWQMPDSIRCATPHARAVSRLNTADESPYALSFAQAIAASSPRTRTMPFTGPNDSSW
jgi:hypothetical protein